MRKSTLNTHSKQVKIIKPNSRALHPSPNSNVPKSSLQISNENDNLEDPPEIIDQIFLEDEIDKAMKSIEIAQFNEAFEPAISSILHSTISIIWMLDKSGEYLYSPTLDRKHSISEFMPSIVLQTRSILQVQNTSRSSGIMISDPDISVDSCPQLFFPFFSNEKPLGIVQVIRNPGDPSFTSPDVSAALSIIQKFDLYCASIFEANPFRQIALSLFTRVPPQNPFEQVLQFFQCKKVDLWMKDIATGQIAVYDFSTKTMAMVTGVDVGIVGNVLNTRSIKNCSIVSQDPSYSAPFDGSYNGALLAVPYEKNRREIWVMVLRGREKPFKFVEEQEATAIVPFVIRGVSGSDSTGMTVIQYLDKMLELMPSLLTVPIDFSSEVERVAKGIIACKYAVFRELRSGGLSEFVATNDQLINSIGPPDVFDSELDCPSCPNPTTILCAPIHNPHQKVIGTIGLYNSPVGDPFTTVDEKIITIFSAFAGIAYENNRVYKTITEQSDLSEQGFSQELLNSSCELFNCQRITLYLRDASTLDLFEFASAGESSPYGVNFAMQAIESSRFRKYEKDRVEKETSIEETVYDITLIDSNNTKIGVLEFTYLDHDRSDFTAMNSLGSIACRWGSASPKLAAFGYGSLSASEWLQADEKLSNKPPKSLAVDTESAKIFYIYQFNVNEWDGVGLIKVIFHVFNRFGLLEGNMISNLQFFNFIEAVRKKHSHKQWRETIDIFQFCAHLLFVGRVDRVYHKTEQIAFFVAALCHRLGLSHQFSATAACEELLEIVSHDECNIFAGFTSGQLKKVWGMIFDIILATQRKVHFEVVNDLSSIIELGEFDPDEDPIHRMMVLKNCLKCAQVCGIARPFEMTKFVQSVRRFDRELGVDELINKYFIPMFQVVGKALPQTLVNVDQIKSNFFTYQKKSCSIN